MKSKKKQIDEFEEEVKLKQKKRLPKKKYKHFSTWLEDLDSSVCFEFSEWR